MIDAMAWVLHTKVIKDNGRSILRKVCVCVCVCVCQREMKNREIELAFVISRSFEMHILAKFKFHTLQQYSIIYFMDLMLVKYAVRVAKLGVI
jgi:hypothetical protein